MYKELIYHILQSLYKGLTKKNILFFILIIHRDFVDFETCTGVSGVAGKSGKSSKGGKTTTDAKAEKQG